MTTFSIIAPTPDAPERVHAAYRNARYARQQEQAIATELALIEGGKDIDVLELERVSRDLDTADDRTADAVLKYLDAIREWERPRAIAS